MNVVRAQLSVSVNWCIKRKVGSNLENQEMNVS